MYIVDIEIKECMMYVKSKKEEYHSCKKETWNERAFCKKENTILLYFQRPFN